MQRVIPQTGAVTLESKKLFDNAGYNPNGISFYSFSTLYIWEPTVCYRYLTDFSSVVCSGVDAVGRYIHMPITEDRGSIASVLRTACEEFSTDRLMPVDSQMLQTLNSVGVVFTDVNEERDLFDYVYNADSLRTLSGKVLHSKRNHINKLLSEYKTEYKSVDGNSIDELKRTADYFAENTEGELAEEAATIKRLINSFTELNMKAGILYVEDMPAAFSIGERIGDTALIHVEKGSKDIPGAYTAINNFFLRDAFPDVRYVNREEDMGIEYLRKAKLSYNPLPFRKLYSARLLLN